MTLKGLPDYVHLKNGHIAKVNSYGLTESGQLRCLFTHIGLSRSKPMTQIKAATKAEYLDYLKNKL